MSTPRIKEDAKDIREEEIYPHSPLSLLGLLAPTSKQYKAEAAFLQLLSASIHAAPEFLDAKKDATALASIAILKKYPELLFKKKEVTDHTGREILASPYQIFLGAGDVWALRQIQKDILPLIKDEKEQAKMETQFKEQFPYCPWPLPEDSSEEMLYDDRNKQQIKEIVKQLATVKKLIDGNRFIHNERLDKAIEALCKLFQPMPGEVIRRGLHFPLAIIKEVYKTYDALQSHWSLFSLNVIKPALDALSTVDGQCCQCGLRNLNMEKGPSRRCDSSYKYPLGQPLNLKLINDKDARLARLVDPHDGYVLFESSSLAYFDWYNKHGVGGWSGISWEGWRLNVPLVLLERLWRTKAEAYGAIYGATRRETHTLSQ